MVPSAAAKGQTTSLDTQLNREHAVYQKPELVPESVRAFVEKPPCSDPVVVGLFQKQNPEVPGMMSPK